MRETDEGCGQGVDSVDGESLDDLKAEVAIARQEILRSEERARQLVDSSPIGIAIYDSIGQCVEANEALAVAVGAPRDALLEQNFRELESWKATGLRERAEAILRGGRPVRCPYDAVTSFGKSARLECFLSPFDDGGLLLMVVDESDRERADDLEKQLQAAQHLETVGRLAGGVAHDFNNILQAIVMHLGFALEQLPLDHPSREDLDEVRTSARRASRLVDQLLAFGRRQVLRIELVDLGELLGGMSRMIGRVVGEHIDVTLDVPHSLDLVEADRGQIEQVIYNLCINARDAMPDGGDLCIRAHTDLLDPDLVSVYPWAVSGPVVCVTVEDSGLGMTAEVLEQIFEPFFSTKAQHEGTGLGLSTAHGIIKQHRGMIRASSRPGEGSVFEICLPRVEGEQASWDESSEYSLQLGGVERILLAEDDDSIRKAVERGLSREGYDVVAAADGAEAVAAFEADPDGFALAVLDVVMPRKSGPQVYADICRIRPDLRVLFSTGYGADSSALKFADAADVELLQKPYDIPTLLMRIRDILDR